MLATRTCADSWSALSSLDCTVIRKDGLVTRWYHTAPNSVQRAAAMNTEPNILHVVHRVLGYTSQPYMERSMLSTKPVGKVSGLVELGHGTEKGPHTVDVVVAITVAVMDAHYVRYLFALCRTEQRCPLRDMHSLQPTP
ncbi:hypothetical protein MTO96_017370 [Rhipicephalus appendiculatus]